MSDSSILSNTAGLAPALFQDCVDRLTYLEDEDALLEERQAAGPAFIEAVEPIIKAIEADIAALRPRPQTVHLAGTSFEMQGGPFVTPLLRRIRTGGLEAGLDWLSRVLTAKAYCGRTLTELRGVTLTGEVVLDCGIRFIPVAAFGPYPSLEKDRSAGVGDPTATPVTCVAEFASTTLPLYDYGEKAFDDGYTLLEAELKRTILGLSMFGPGAVASNSWREQTDPDVADVDQLSGYSAADQFNRVHYLQPIGLGGRETTLLNLFLETRGKFGARIDLALGRLNSAYGRIDDEDQLLDLSIAFEALLGDEKNELTFRYALRAALLLGTTTADRQSIRTSVTKMYALRSKVVHGSTVKENLREVAREAMAQVGLLIQTFVTLGHEPDWSTLELGGGLS